MKLFQRFTLVAALVWGFAVLVAPAQSETAPQTMGNPKPVVIARIAGDDEVTVADFVQYISKSAELLTAVREQSKKIQVIREMIIQRLFARAIREEGLLKTKGKSPTRQEWVEAHQRLKERHFPLPPPPSEEKLKEYYNLHKEQFGIPRMVRISQIQFRAPLKPTEKELAEVKEKAEVALKRLDAGEPLEEVAVITENPLGKEKKGDLGFLPLGPDPWLDNAVSNLGKGQHTGVIRSPVGYEILVVTDMRDPIIVPFDTMKGPVLEQMRRNQQTQTRDQYAHMLAKKYHVEILLDGFKEAMP